MKKVAKSLVVSVLGWQVRRLRRKHDFRIIGIGGSMGKTSTKFALAAVLKQKFKIRYQQGNYNDIASVPLVFFGQNMPSLFNPLAWLVTFIKNEAVIRKVYPVDFVIVELGTDGPGQIAKFNQYLYLDIAILTAIAPEHMEFFEDLDAVAAEELSIAGLSKKLFFNADLCPAQYRQKIGGEHYAYGTITGVSYRLSGLKRDKHGFGFVVSKGNQSIIKTHHSSIAKTQLFSICAAVAVAHELDLTEPLIQKGIKAIRPANGRMRVLEGINSSVIIDDTYNASPDAVKTALDTLYENKAPQKIAVLGNMNELGRFSPDAHSKVGEYCDPKQLDMVLTIGPDANRYLAAAAKKQGCEVETFDNPYAAADFLKEAIRPQALILAKGSQNGVFAEETVKQILADSRDVSKLVRQEPHWLKIKAKQFKTVRGV